MIDFDSAPSSNSTRPRSKSSSPQEFAPSWTPDSIPGQGIRSQEVPSYIQSLNDKQREAALITEGPLIVLAGAGSGKTKMLTSRISYLIDQLRVPPYMVLAVTFTNKAAGEMRERVEKTLHAAGSTAVGQPEIGTFHSVCVRLLRREIGRTPFTRPFVIYDDSDQLSLLKTIFDKLGLDEKVVSPKGVQSAINRAKCDAVEPHEMEPSPHNFFEKQVKRIYEQYQKDLFTNNALDFGEIICMAYRLLRDNEDLRQKYQHRFRYIHVDEYQDTNRSQYLLLTMLANRKYGGHQNICVVGDEDQSIYKWRGADIRNIMDFEKDYPGAQVVKLEQNYRSSKTIIRAAGQVIKNNKSRKDKTLWTDNAEGVPIVRAQLPDERSEAELTVFEIKKLGEADSRAYGEFSIFYRTNAQSRQFEDVLRRENIPYQIVGGLRFYDRKEIKDIISYFKAVLNPSDSISLKRIINVPARGIGKTTLDKLDAFYASPEAQGRNFWEVLQLATKDTSVLSASTAKKLVPFITLLQRLMDEQPKLMLSELYHLILDETAYVRELRKENTEESLSRIENMEEFDTLLQEFEEDQLGDLAQEEHDAKRAELLPIFVEQSTLASDSDKLDNKASSVKLMTLHSSKGLEFPVVFLVGMEEGLFPSIKTWEETPEEDIEEERRLCYVGMTRAREHLYLMNVVVRRIWGNSNYREPSRFFKEMPEELIEFRDFSQRITPQSGGWGRPSGQAAQGQGFQRPAQTQQQPRVESLGGGRSLVYDGDAAPGNRGDLVGAKINHPEYGPGTILAVEGANDDQKVTVEFRGRDRRKFLLRYLASFFE